ncbi:hypothetical protein ACFQ69_36215 [Streptomyces sp. NPDC056470]|uniref:hypothetical protein n=1 Tax=Streptomyces sp. NPDC056470 TaxID=3345831 RepID=UPI0036CED27A
MARAHKGFTPSFDKTFGDRALAVACEDIAFGRWQDLCEFLHDTGQDWDRRTFRMRLLAQAAAGTAVAEHWHAADPRNPDALVLRAETEVMRVFNLAAAGTVFDTDLLDRAVRTCLRAAEAAPSDPVPWVSLLTIARLFPGGHQKMEHWYQELLARDQDNREAHHMSLRYLSARWHGSHGAMYDFARDVLSSVALGSPLAVLLLVARAEEYRYRVEREGPTAPGLLFHWTSEFAKNDLQRMWNVWIAHRDAREKAQDVADLNYAVHAACMTGEKGAARYLFELLGNRATQIPWSYLGDPAAVITRRHAAVMQ